MKDIAVITSSVGANDLLEPRYKLHADFHAFVEPNRLEVDDGWDKKPVTVSTIDEAFVGRRTAKIYKVLPQLFVPGYKYYIWIDSTHMVAQDPKEIVETYLNGSDLALFQHYRDCVYDELKAIYQWKMDDRSLIQGWHDFLVSKNYPKHNGLYELPSRVFRNTPQMLQVGLMWWEIICKYSSRDQVSLPYVLHTLGVKPNIIPGRANANEGNNNIIRQMTFSRHKRVTNK